MLLRPQSGIKVLRCGTDARTAMLAVAIFGYETSTYTPSSDDESLKSAKWAAGFGALLGFPCTLFPGNLHWGSPAQWPMPPHRRH